MRKAAQAVSLSPSQLSRRIKQYMESLELRTRVEALAGAVETSKRGKRSTTTSSGGRGGSTVTTAKAVREFITPGAYDDLTHVLNLYSLPLDPKLPVLMKQVKDTAWWMHVVHDLGVAAFTVLAPLAEDKIDYDNPEKTVSALIHALRGLKEAAAKYEEERQKLATEIEKLRAENKALREAIDKMSEHVRDLSETVRKLKNVLVKVLRTVFHEVPEVLPREARMKYWYAIQPIREEVEALV